MGNKWRSRNHTVMTGFIILGFSNVQELQSLIGFLVLVIYLLNLMGNLTILIIIHLDPHLHTPMYFFLGNLSILDMCYATDTLHKILDGFLTGDKFISFHACMVQMYFFTTFACSEFYLLSVMAYDRYVAICNPLRYSLIMNKRVCILLATVSWLISFSGSVPYPLMVSRLSFCKSNEINHFFCDLTALLKLSCSDTLPVELTVLIESGIFGMSPFLLTLTSYVYIISAILRIRSTEGRSKAFSTCSSHLTAVILFYGTVMCTYLRPASMYSLNRDKLLALLYTAVIPMLNPLIYSLKNKQVKDALKRVVNGKICSFCNAKAMIH
ncbi:olfactory receptor 1052-like [Rhinatrema bivittatum]|uniref:olfactory receptor 1052-like n=1 Tax=Rhinatrema bivittatum TaxID=194408 RepID=UPI00112A5502|nr:olfactory receptor 1052-like [Rhinatrema bivittatum]